MVYKRLLYLIFTLSTHLAFSKVLIFDLHGVMVDHSPWTIADYLGKMNCWRYCGLDTGKIKTRFDEFLFLLEKNDNPNNKHLKLEKNKQPFPKILQEWQRGKKTTRDTIAAFKKEIEKHKDFFTSDLEKQLITGIIETMLPDQVLNVLTPVDDMVKLVKECHQIAYDDGEKCHQLFILTNWDKDSFPRLLTHKKFSPVFACFEKNSIIVSSDVGLIKPEPAIYEYVIKTFNLDPKECILIDDQVANIEAAEKMGMKVHLHIDASSTKKFLQNNGIFTKPGKKPAPKKEPLPASKKEAVVVSPQPVQQKKAESISKASSDHKELT